MIKALLVQALLAWPVYMVLRSVAVDDGTFVDHASAALVSLALSALWAKLMAK